MDGRVIGRTRTSREASEGAEGRKWAGWLRVRRTEYIRSACLSESDTSVAKSAAGQVQQSPRQAPFMLWKLYRSIDESIERWRTEICAPESLWHRGFSSQFVLPAAL